MLRVLAVRLNQPNPKMPEFSMVKEDGLNRLMNAAMALLVRREYSRAELRERLLRRFPEPAVETVLDMLAQQDLQSDTRFVENFVRYRVRQGKGPQKIRQDLLLKGIDADLVNELIPSDPEFWLEVAKEVYHRKYDGIAGSQQELGRRLRFMVARGFSANQVYAIVR